MQESSAKSTWPDLDGTVLPKRLLTIASDEAGPGADAGSTSLVHRVTTIFQQHRDSVFRYLMNLCGAPEQSESMLLPTRQALGSDVAFS